MTSNRIILLGQAVTEAKSTLYIEVYGVGNINTLLKLN